MQQFKFFRPSSGPAKELCGHFVPTISTSPNARRGIEFHEWIAKILREEAKIEDAPVDLRQPLSWALAKVPELFQEVEAIEQKIVIYGPPGPGDEGEEKVYITEGTCDLWGWSKVLPRPALVDWKTGHEKDYWAQLIIYAAGVLEPLLQMQQKDDILIDMYLAFVDQERLFHQTLTYKEINERLQLIIQNARDPRSPYSINEYCGYCDLRGECPAWDRERALLVSGGPESLQERFSQIRSDPEKLGRFIEAYRRFCRVVEAEKFEAQVLDYLQEGKYVPGVIRVVKQGTEQLKAHKLYRLIDLFMQSQTRPRSLLDEFLKVDIKAARELWASAFNEPFPETYRSATTYYIKTTNGK